MSSDLPSPNDDYVATDATRLSKAVWNAVFGSIGSRIRALEAVQADFEALIALGTGQALASIAANVEPELVAARAALAQLQADTAAAEDVVAAIVAGSIPQGSVDGLVAALAGKASAADVAAALADLVGSAPATLDTIAELAAALDGDASAIATITAALGQRLRVDVAQGLSGAQKAQAWANLGLAAVASSGSYGDLTNKPTALAPVRNRHLNPAFQICQDRAAGATVVKSAGGYAFDGIDSTITGGGALTWSQVAKATPGGSPYRLRAAVSTVDTSIATSDAYLIEFPIEGVDVSDLMFGTASARSFVWRGVVNFPAGTYGLSFRNAAATRSYVTTFTVSAGEAGTDKLVTVTVPGDTTGTWINDASGIGISVRITLAAGTTYQTTTTGAWQVGNYVTTSAQTNAMASTSNVFEVADIGLYAGSELPTWEMPSFADDLRKCLRYYEIIAMAIGSSGCWGTGYYAVPKRVTPSIGNQVLAGGSGASVVPYDTKSFSQSGWNSNASSIAAIANARL